jgi:hypothetical protein
VDVEVRLVDRIAGRPVSGPAVRLSVPARVEAAYRILRRGLPGRSSVRAVVTSDAEVRVPGLLLVAAQGDTWPLAAGDGQTLAELPAVDVGPGRPAVLTARLPRGRGLWVRCFAVGEDVVLIDPPARTLRFGSARTERGG